MDLGIILHKWQAILPLCGMLSFCLWAEDNVCSVLHAVQWPDLTNNYVYMYGALPREWLTELLTCMCS